MIPPEGFTPDTEVMCSSGEQCLAKGDLRKFPRAPLLPLREFSLSNEQTEHRRPSFRNQCRHCHNGGVLTYAVPPLGYFRCTFGADCVTGDPVQRGRGNGYAAPNPALCLRMAVP